MIKIEDLWHNIEPRYTIFIHFFSFYARLIELVSNSSILASSYRIMVVHAYLKLFNSTMEFCESSPFSRIYPIFFFESFFNFILFHARFLFVFSPTSVTCHMSLGSFPINHISRLAFFILHTCIICGAFECVREI